MSIGRLLLEHRLHSRIQPIETLAQIDWLEGDQNPGGSREAEHVNRPFPPVRRPSPHGPGRSNAAPGRWATEVQRPNSPETEPPKAAPPGRRGLSCQAAPAGIPADESTAEAYPP